MTHHTTTPSRRRALVTGGTSGIGAAIAVALARTGCDVTATGRTDAEMAAFADGLAERPEFAARITPAVLDVSDADAIARLATTFDRLDAVVNCAGMILRGGQEFDPERFAEVVDVNLTGTMRVCTACRPLLAASRGCIVNTASMLTFFGSGYAPGYSASKGGVGQLTKSLAIAWAPEGIRVNAVAPGWIRTPLTEPLASDPDRSRPIVERTPMKRWGSPDDVAGAVLFLCSPAASFITGVILPVDGGYSIA